MLRSTLQTQSEFHGSLCHFLLFWLGFVVILLFCPLGFVSFIFVYLVCAWHFVVVLCCLLGLFSFEKEKGHELRLMRSWEGSRGIGEAERI